MSSRLHAANDAVQKAEATAAKYQRTWGYDRFDEQMIDGPGNKPIEVKSFLHDIEGKAYAYDIVKNLQKTGFPKAYFAGYFTDGTMHYGKAIGVNDSLKFEIKVYPKSPYFMNDQQQ